MWIEHQGMIQWYRLFNRSPQMMVRILSLYIAGERRAEISPLIPLAKGLPEGTLRKEIRRHLADEGFHARILADRIQALGGEVYEVPRELEPQEFFYKKEGNLKGWLDAAGRGAPLERKRVIEILLFNHVLEASGVSNFYAHAEATRDEDPETYFLLMRLLPDEIRHATYTIEWAYRLAGRDLYDFTNETRARFLDLQTRYWATVMRLMLEKLIPRDVSGLGRLEHGAWMAIARRQERRGVKPVEVMPMPRPELLIARPAPYGMVMDEELRRLVDVLDHPAARAA